MHKNPSFNSEQHFEEWTSVLFNPNTRRKSIRTREVIKLEASGSLTEQTWTELAITNCRAILVVSDASLNENGS